MSNEPKDHVESKAETEQKVIVVTAEDPVALAAVEAAMKRSMDRAAPIYEKLAVN